jgi:hypothetical protein
VTERTVNVLNVFPFGGTCAPCVFSDSFEAFHAEKMLIESKIPASRREMTTLPSISCRGLAVAAKPMHEVCPGAIRCCCCCPSTHAITKNAQQPGVGPEVGEHCGQCGPGYFAVVGDPQGAPMKPPSSRPTRVGPRMLVILAHCTRIGCAVPLRNTRSWRKSTNWTQSSTHWSVLPRPRPGVCAKSGFDLLPFADS